MKFTFNKFKHLLIGVIAGSLLTSGAVFAGNSEYVLSLFEAKLVFNGQEKQGSEKPYMYNNGKDYVPTSLIYNGTTYVPLRFFAESMGQPVDYKGETQTIYVGKVPEGEKVARYMSDILKPFYSSSYSGLQVSNNITMAGKQYKKGFSIIFNNDVTSSFNLEGKYENINGLVGLLDENNRYDATVDFYGDDKLITSIQLDKGSLPKDLNINVNGVIRLDIKYKSGGSFLGLANIMIK